jgi:hypothetical protein
VKEKNYSALLALLACFTLTGMAPAIPGNPDEDGPPPTQPTPKPKPTEPTNGGVAANLERLKQQLAISHREIPKKAIDKAFNYFASHQTSVKNKDFVTIVDFTKPSSKKRMYQIHMASGSVDTYFSAHGVNSGGDYPTKFSNVEGSKKSSIGIYVTGDQYYGGNGLSMYLHGKESTNSNAYDRLIVMHGADYANQDFVDRNGRLGRSWGCPAVDTRYSDQLVKELQDGSVFLIWYE